MKAFLLDAILSCSPTASRQRWEMLSGRAEQGWSWLRDSGKGPLLPGVRATGTDLGWGRQQVSGMGAREPPCAQC